MYMAYEKKKGFPRFFLRESVRLGNEWTFRNLYDLGPDPAVHILYPGGNAFYFDESMEEALSASGAVYDSDDLEEIFLPWIRSDVRNRIQDFMKRSIRSTHKKLTEAQKEEILKTVPEFDKRRAHYLKFGTMDQGPVENMPAVLFTRHIHKSRDEIEQWFFRQESRLSLRELKSYVYTVFNLHRFFQGMLAKKMPHVLDQDKVDEYFLSEVCRMNSDVYHRDKILDDHLIRYLIMFFDHAYAETTLLDDMAHAFMNRHRKFRPRPVKSITVEKACTLFNIKPDELKTLTKKQLARRYRKLARKVHPDTGGTHEKFVELSEAYDILLKSLPSPGEQN